MDETERRAFAQAEEHQRFMAETEQERLHRLMQQNPPAPFTDRRTQLDRIEAKLDRLLEALDG